MNVTIWNNQSTWCASTTTSVYWYGHLIPAVALVIFGLTFNPIALYYFATSKNFRRSAYSYYFSAIAVVDIIRLGLWFFFYWLDFKILKLKFQSYECPTQVFAESVASSISAWLTVSLTVERCLVIYKPFQALTDTRGKRALLIILCVTLASCALNSLFLIPGFYTKRVYREASITIVCHYEQSIGGNSTSSKSSTWLTSNIKRVYLLFVVIFRVAVPFLLLSLTNIILFVSVRRTSHKAQNNSTFLVRHGHHRQITPMIFFSSCILLLTISPRYLLQFYMNFVGSYNRHCSFFHFAPHLLKTLELFNYAFNVFVSIVSGKHGRRELFDMLLCRTMSNQTPRSQGTLKTPGTSSPKTYTLLRFQLKQNRDNSTMLLNNPPRVPLIPVTHSSTSNGSRNGQRPNHYHFA